MMIPDLQTAAFPLPSYMGREREREGEGERETERERERERGGGGSFLVSVLSRVLIPSWGPHLYDLIEAQLTAKGRISKDHHIRN